MPTISEFNGISVTMNYREHGPPHFHVRYGEYRAFVGLNPVKVLKGRLPPRIQASVIKWGTQRREELIDNWNRARAERPLAPVAPPE